MIEFENLATRTSTKSGSEVDAVEHRRELHWGRGEARKIDQAGDEPSLPP